MTSTHYLVFFFFQAEDGIRDRNGTGVQTCALPICAIFNQKQIMPAADIGNGRKVAGMRSEERRVGKSVDLGGRRIIKKKKKTKKNIINQKKKQKNNNKNKVIKYRIL